MASCRHLHDGGLSRVGRPIRYCDRLEPDFDDRVAHGACACTIHIDADRFTARPAMLMKEILGALGIDRRVEDAPEQGPPWAGDDCVAKSRRRPHHGTG